MRMNVAVHAAFVDPDYFRHVQTEEPEWYEIGEHDTVMCLMIQIEARQGLQAHNVLLELKTSSDITVHMFCRHERVTETIEALNEEHGGFVSMWFIATSSGMIRLPTTNRKHAAVA